MAASNPEFPRRLVDGEQPGAALIARALAEPPAGPSELQSWQRLDARLARPPVRWALPAALVVVVAAAALVMWQRKPAPSLSLTPELLPRPASVARGVPPAPEPAPERTDVAKAPPLRPKAVPPARRETSAGECAELAKGGKYQAASTCYGSVAGGDSMDAELALYEKARLEAKALGQSAQALATLDEHTRRFAGGVLTSEVELTRIELLSQLGRRDEALRGIERGLQSTLGRERGADLQVMKAELLSVSGACSEALGAVRLARQAGVHASRLQASEQRCGSPNEAP